MLNLNRQDNYGSESSFNLDAGRPNEKELIKNNTLKGKSLLCLKKSKKIKK